MGTKKQAMGYRDFHYTGRHDCTKKVGPRGGLSVESGVNSALSYRHHGEKGTL